MKKLLCLVVVITILFSCKNEKETDKFIVTGDIKNVPDQKIYLEEIYFSQKDPEVVDTAEVKNGKIYPIGFSAAGRPVPPPPGERKNSVYFYK